jgi:prepilin-type N-terminal cleavage/methylation domain-containing protein
MHSTARPKWMRRGLRVPGFTLIELLTVITIIAILATLLMTTLGSAKRKAREAVCASNLHQIGIALHLYLEDFGQRPADLQVLVKGKYLGDGRILHCPADRESAATPTSEAASGFNAVLDPQGDKSSPGMRVSYEHPLRWPDEQWNRLMQAQTRAGVVVCPFHDLHAGSREITAAGTGKGLILRGQLDGTVVRRQIFLGAEQSDAGNLARGNLGVAVGANTPASGEATSLSDPPWELFSDDPIP